MNASLRPFKLIINYLNVENKTVHTQIYRYIYIYMYVVCICKYVHVSIYVCMKMCVCIIMKCETYKVTRNAVLCLPSKGKVKLQKLN